MGVAAILILIMRFLDRNYQLYQRAAGTRAAELEGILNFRLEKTIREEYAVHRMWQYVRLVYFGFGTAVLILGWAIVWGKGPIGLSRVPCACLRHPNDAMDGDQR